MVNWFIYQGLSRYGFKTEAEQLKQQTLIAIEDGGFSEYFNIFSSAPLGVKNFSPTAGIALSLMSE
jgi:hypothetical protein